MTRVPVAASRAPARWSHRVTLAGVWALVLYMSAVSISLLLLRQEDQRGWQKWAGNVQVTVKAVSPTGFGKSTVVSLCISGERRLEEAGQSASLICVFISWTLDRILPVTDAEAVGGKWLGEMSSALRGLRWGPCPLFLLKIRSPCFVKLITAFPTCPQEEGMTLLVKTNVYSF